MKIYNAVLELGRDCNADCPHCLRGPKQHRKLSNAQIDVFFDRVTSIDCLTLTGGEPSLYARTIQYALNSAIAHSVTIEHVYVKTNALSISKAFVDAMLAWWEHLTKDVQYKWIEWDYPPVQVIWSCDEYHDFPKDIAMLSGLSFAKPEHKNEFEPRMGLIAEGNAQDWSAAREHRPETFEIDEDCITEGSIYLNAKGNIVAGCDWSYQSQDMIEHIICHVSELTIEKVQEYMYLTFGGATCNN